MKDFINELNKLLPLAGMVLFLFFSFYGSFAIDGKCELNREIEYTGHCGEKSESDCPGAVVATDKIKEHDHEVDVRSYDDRPLAEPVASEDQHKFHDRNRDTGSQDGANLVPMNDCLDEKPGSRKRRCEHCDDVVVECHRNTLHSLMCLFVMLLPVAFKGIIAQSAPAPTTNH